jgi:hypothetical protein
LLWLENSITRAAGLNFVQTEDKGWKAFLQDKAESNSKIEAFLDLAAYARFLFLTTLKYKTPHIRLALLSPRRVTPMPCLSFVLALRATLTPLGWVRSAAISERCIKFLAVLAQKVRLLSTLCSVLLPQ